MSALTQSKEQDEAPVNEVRLVGRVSTAPEQRELPSGDNLWTFRITIERPEGAGRTRQRSDTLDCAVWRGRVKRSVAGWVVGDVVELAGSVRKRFFSTGGATATRVEVEVARGKLIRRARTG